MTTAMPPLWLDYQRPPPGRQVPGMVLLAASVIFSGLLLSMAVDLASETADAQQQVFKLRQAAERRRLFETAEKPAVEAAGAEPGQPESPSAIRWESLFSSLEAAGNDTVTLLGLAPGPREIVITGEASGLAAALDYAQRLQAAKALTNAHLSKYEVVREHPRQPVRFTLLAEWREGPR